LARLHAGRVCGGGLLLLKCTSRQMKARCMCVCV
jgi:hypothetical protein